MRLLLTLDFPPENGGIQHYLYGIVTHEYGPADRVLTIHKDHGLQSDEKCVCPIERVTFPFLGINKKVALIPLVFKFLKYTLLGKRANDISIECGNVYAGIIPWLFHLFTKREYSVYTYGTELLRACRKDPIALILRSVLRNAKKINVLGKHTQSLNERLGSKGPFKTITPRIIVDKSIVAAPIIKKTIKSPIRLFTIGRLVEHKGHHVLIQAISLIFKDLPCNLVIAGRGPQELVLRNLIKENSMESIITIDTTMTDNQIREKFTNTDIFILPSIETQTGTEGFGIVLLDSMAHGVPIIASNCGGIPEVLDNGECGILVESGKPEMLAGAIKRLAIDEDLAYDYRLKSRTRLLNHYVW